MTITLEDLFPFYDGFRANQSWKDGGELLVRVDCGCKGQMVPGDDGRALFLMELCPVHEQKVRPHTQ